MNWFRRLHRHLDPGDTLGELIFGLIMVLTFTLGARLLESSDEPDGRELLIAAIGCNIAWGIIDGFLFALGRIFERLRVATLVDSVRLASDEPAAVAALQAELDSDLTGLGDPPARDKFYASIVAAVRKQPKETVRILADDLLGAVRVFCLVVATALPAALPFLLLENGYVALRVSNTLLIGSLFVVGFFWGRHVRARPLLAGSLVMSIGIVLVLIAVPLGG
jgi:hypothetical protein